MRYQVSQKMLALGGDFTIRDENGREAYYIDGKVFNFGGKRYIVLDSNRRQIALIRKKLFSFKPTYTVKRSGHIVASIRQRAFTVRDQFIIDVPGSNDYQVVGDYIGFEYTVKYDSRDVARVSKKFFGATDSYGVDIAGGDPLLILCAVVVIDVVLHPKLKSPGA